MHDDWSTFQILSQKDKEGQTADLNYVFPKGKSLAVMFAESKEMLPETRRNFLATLAARPEFKSRLVKEFWFGSEKIYEVYEIDRRLMGTPVDDAASNPGTAVTRQLRRQARASQVATL